MAKKVTVSVIGGQTKTYDNFATIGDVKTSLGLGEYTAMQDGNPTDDASLLSDFSYVTLAAPVKSGC